MLKYFSCHQPSRTTIGGVDFAQYRFVANHIIKYRLAQSQVCQNLNNFMLSVAADIISHYACKWLDNKPIKKLAVPAAGFWCSR